MVIKTLFGLTALGGLVLLTSCQQPSQTVSSFCVARLENNGFINIVPTTVLVDGAEAMTLNGGERACKALSPGQHDVQLAWTWDPRDPSPRRVITESTSVIVARSETTVRKVCLEREANYPTWQVVPDWQVGEFGECRPK